MEIRPEHGHHSSARSADPANYQLRGTDPNSASIRFRTSKFAFHVAHQSACHFWITSRCTTLPWRSHRLWTGIRRTCLSLSHSWQLRRKPDFGAVKEPSRFEYGSSLGPNNTARRSLAVIVVFLLALPTQGFGLSLPARQEKQPDQIHQLWSAAIDPMLRSNLRSSEQAYTEGQELLVPLHAAFVLRDDAWERGFSLNFSRLVADPSVLPDVVLSRLEYLYLASEFLALSKQSGREDLVPTEGSGTCCSVKFARTGRWRQPGTGAGNHFRAEFAKEFSGSSIPANRTRGTTGRLSMTTCSCLAIAADLKVFAGTSEHTQAWDATLDDILAIAYRVFSQEGAFQPRGGWLFQPGVWADHPEYRYAGNAAAERGIRPAPVPGIAADTSHSMRFAAWLTSLMLACPPASDGYRFLCQPAGGT